MLGDLRARDVIGIVATLSHAAAVVFTPATRRTIEEDKAARSALGLVGAPAEHRATENFLKHFMIDELRHREQHALHYGSTHGEVEQILREGYAYSADCVRAAAEGTEKPEASSRVRKTSGCQQGGLIGGASPLSPLSPRLSSLPRAALSFPRRARLARVLCLPRGTLLSLTAQISLSILL